MKKIFESKLNGWGESATKVHVYALDSTDEYWDLDDMNFDDKCMYFGVSEEPSYAVAPGAMYRMYNFELSGHHVIMYETLALNV